MLSIIIPVFNGEEYISRCISSVLKQTEINFEVIVVDDGSTDDTRNICDRFAVLDERVRVFSQENQGVSVARNKGMSLANGKWIMFVDSDDWIDEDICLLCRDTKDTVEVIFFGISKTVNRNCKCFTGEEDIVTLSDFSMLQKKILNSQYEIKYESELHFELCFGKIYNAEFLHANDICFPEHISYAEDTLFVSQVYRKAREGRVVLKKGYNYYIREDSVSHRFTPEMINNVRNTVDMLYDEYSNEDYIHELDVYAVIKFLRCVFMDYCNCNNKESYYVRKIKFSNAITEEWVAHGIKNVKYRQLGKNYKQILSVFLLKHNLFWGLNIVYKMMQLLNIRLK